MKTDVKVTKESELQIVSRQFIDCEYDNPFTKVDRLLFLEIMDSIKNFYIGKSDQYITKFSSEVIQVQIPNLKFKTNSYLKKKNLYNQLRNSSKRLLKIQYSEELLNGRKQKSFQFMNLFSSLEYSTESGLLSMTINKNTFEKMLNIKSYAQLNFDHINLLNYGYSIRIYEIIQSNYYKRSFVFSFEKLRGMLGFKKSGMYEEWFRFNQKILKPSIKLINEKVDDLYIVSYKKERNQSNINFTIIKSQKVLEKPKKIKILSLDEEYNYKPNLIQKKYIDSVLEKTCSNLKYDERNRVFNWIVFDFKTRNNKVIGFKHFMNAIAKQLVDHSYTKPYAYKYQEGVLEFNEDIYNEIKSLVEKGANLEDILKKFSKNEIRANSFSYLLSEQIPKNKAKQTKALVDDLTRKLSIIQA